MTENNDDLAFAFEEMTSIALWAARRAKSKYYRQFAHRNIREVIEVSGVDNEFTRSCLAIVKEELPE